MSTCTNIIVFLPLMLMGGVGDLAFWMLRIGVPVIVSLVASLFIALVFVPLAAQRLSRGHQHKELKTILWLRQRYLKSLAWVLTHRMETVLLVLLAMVSVYYPYNNLPRSFSGGGMGGGGFNSGNSMSLHFELPTGGTLEQADEFFVKFETFLQAQKDRYNVERIETRFRYNFG